MDTAPSFIGAFASDWPWPSPLPGAQLVATRFYPTRLEELTGADSVSACQGIALPRRLQGAIAKRRAEFVAGRLCARRAMWLLDGRDATPSMNDDRSPHWPADCVGAITHQDGWAAALVAHRQAYQGVGLDAERLLDAKEARRLAGRVLTAKENARLEGLAPSIVAQMVSSTFSLKESLFKALYPLVGRMFHFQAAELVAWNGMGPVRLRLLTDLGKGWSRGTEVCGMVCLHDARLLSLVALPAPDS